MAKEKDLENRVKAFLKGHDCWYVKYWGGGGYTRKGVPDLLACCNGVFVAIELKAPKGRPTDLQIRELHRIRDSGGIAILMYPKDYDLFQNLIMAIEGERWELVRACKEIFEERMEDYERHCK